MSTIPTTPFSKSLIISYGTDLAAPSDDTEAHSILHSIMNNMYNSTPHRDNASGQFSAQQAKMSMGQRPGSLYSMLYDVDSPVPSLQESMVGGARMQHPSAAFHPVDEYKDLSLKEILELSDDFLFNDGDDSLFGGLDPTPLAPSPKIAYSGGFTIPSQVALPTSSYPDFAPTSFNDSYNSLSQVTPSVSPNNKRSREQFDALEDEDDGHRFRPYQAGQWAEKFEELVTYKKQTGHCLVPHTYQANLPLARWVKRQRYQYKLMHEGKSSTMTEERVQALEKIGFVWDSQGAAWGERLAELREFRDRFMHCNVPSNFTENPQLATWVKCQRRQYKLHAEGKPSNMTNSRIQQLNTLGFEWELRNYKRARVC